MSSPMTTETNKCFASKNKVNLNRRSKDVQHSFKSFCGFCYIVQSIGSSGRVNIVYKEL